ncbi:MAG: AAA family ATPase [Gudongella sp.]|jgi:DNA sulfur modification protein DndD|nr:AAA family ATPase [Gudongella sp.]
MITRKIEFENFRCFYGHHEINLADKCESPVTLIHAQNGVGKTTILNALFWCFHNKFTERFEHRDKIINNDAERKGIREASVQIEFEHGDKLYTATRKFYKNSADTSFHMDYMSLNIGDGPIDEGTVQQPNLIIESIIPSGMAPYFLFDGEHAENFAGKDSNKIKSAVRDILGCTIVEKAIKHVGEVLKDYEKERNKVKVSTQSDELRRRKDHSEEIIRQNQQRLEEIKKSIENKREQIKDIDRFLSKVDASRIKELNSKRTKTEEDLKKFQSDKTNKELSQSKWLSENAKFLVAKKITEDTKDFIEEASTKGIIPAPYNETFIQDITNNKVCICGRPLEQGSPEYTKVISLLENATNAIVESRIGKIRGRIAEFEKQKENAPERYFGYAKDLTYIGESISRLEKELESINKEIGESNIESIREKESNRIRLKDNIVALEREEFQCNRLINEHESNVESLGRELQKNEFNNKEFKKATQIINNVKAIKDVLENKLIEEESGAIDIIQKYISDIVDKIMRKNVSIKLDENYNITMEDYSGTITGRSSGENQLIGLAFTVALIKFAKDRQSNQSDYFLSGTEAPLLLDSPFGQLDDLYKQSTAEFIPHCASQVVMLLSSSQSKDISDILDKYVTKEYILVRHNKGSKSETKDEMIKDLSGNAHQVTFYDMEYDTTKILSVR